MIVAPSEMHVLYATVGIFFYLSIYSKALLISICKKRTINH